MGIMDKFLDIMRLNDDDDDDDYEYENEEYEDDYECGGYEEDYAWTEEDSWNALTDGMYGDMPSNPMEYDAMMDALGF